jgi:hypothetical protein
MLRVPTRHPQKPPATANIARTMAMVKVMPLPGDAPCLLFVADKMKHSPVNKKDQEWNGISS